MTPKIATCCYCGTRAALVLTGTTRHELACSACGAPLHNMKMLKAERDATAPSRKQARGRPSAEPTHRPTKSKRKKKKKSKTKWLMGEAWDLLEDIFD